MTLPDARVLDARLVPSALGCWGVCLVAIRAGSSWGAVAVVLCCLVASAVVAAAASRAGSVMGGLRTPVVTVVVSAAIMTAGVGVGVGTRVHAVETDPLRGAAGTYATVTGVISDDPRLLNSSFAPTALLTVRAEHAVVRGTNIAVHSRLTVFAPQDVWSDLGPGREVTFRGRLEVPDREDLTAATVRVSDPPSAVTGPPWYQRAAGTIRDRLASASANALPTDAAGLLPAIVVGDTTGLSDTVDRQFTDAGLKHLCVVSGANFTFLIGAVLLAARGATMGPRSTVIVAGVVLVGFVVVARPSPSVLRAAVMGTVGLLAFVTGRRKHALPALAAAVIVLLSVDPAMAVRPGFALSVIATAALIVVAPVVTRRFAAVFPGPVADALAVALAAHLVTAPVIAALSGTFSTVSVVANVLVAPVIGPITVIGALAAVVALVHSPTAEIIIRGSGPPLRWLLTVADVSSSAPLASVSVPFGFVGVAGVAVVSGALLLLLMRRWGGVGRRR